MSPLHRGLWSDSHPGGRAPSTHSIEGWVGLRLVLGPMQDSKLLSSSP